MNRRTYLTALGTAMLTVSAGCTSEATKEDIMSELTDVTELDEDGLGGESVTRFIDREAGVVIYQYYAAQAGGMTAMPIEETDLR